MTGMTVVERAERKTALLRQTVGLVERLRIVEAEHASLIKQRDDQCRELRAAGVAIKELQEAFGVSRSRIQQILSDS
ncbi:hypothetical protein GCM10027169_00080 [Gordonia jinhuaensis]|uniref:Uncharacterized protein n=2 Tax=Gordonia jinhuaensis TaxID=1517702 RepID=A0A916SUV0_9ACTN|nr:hypothetical protein GCM10011489_02740 [Gordonia jinhuaensis]